MRKALIAALAAFVGMGTSAYAADLGGSMKDAPVYDAPITSWTGLYIGAGVGVGSSNTEADLTVNDREESFELLSFDGIGGEGMFGTVQLGFDYQLSSRFVVGAFVDYDFSNINSELNVFERYNAELDLESMWSVGARLGWLATPDTLWYALLAYTQAQYDLSDNAGFLDAVTDVDSFDGWTVGLGVETRLTSNWSLKAEYRYTQFDAETIFAIGGEGESLDVDFEPSVHTGRVVLSYRINPFERGLEPSK
jgi:outer membrane immunogenic protein